MIRAILMAAMVSAASPVQGSVFGPVVSVNGSTFTITTSLSPNGKAIVSAASARITELGTAPRSALKVGACVMASGTRNSKGLVTAQRISISAPVQGKCGGNFFRVGGGGGPRVTPPAGGGTGQPPAGGFRPSGNFGFAFGQVTKLGGSTLTVKGTDFRTNKATTTTVSFTSKTTLFETKTVKTVPLKTCAFVRGTSTDKGKTVKATDVSLTPEANGTCTSGFRRPGG